MFKNIRYLYLLNKYIKCKFGGQRCSTSTIVDITRLKVKSHYTDAPIHGLFHLPFLLFLEYKQALISSIDLLPSYWAILYYVPDAPLFLQTHPAACREHTHTHTRARERERERERESTLFLSLLITKTAFPPHCVLHG